MSAHLCRLAGITLTWPYATINFPALAIPAALAILIWVARARRAGMPSGIITLRLAFAAYVLAVIDVTQFPIELYAARTLAASFDMWERIVLVPIVPLVTYVPRQMVLNLLLGVPFGFLALMSFGGTGRRMLGRACGFFLSVELLQLATLLLLGYSSRVVDVNDWLLNSTGAMLGYLVTLVVVVPIIRMVGLADAPDGFWAPIEQRILGIRGPRSFPRPSRPQTPPSL